MKTSCLRGNVAVKDLGPDSYYTGECWLQVEDGEHLVVVKPDGTRCTSLEEALTFARYGDQPIPQRIELLPETAELRLVCVPAKYLPDDFESGEGDEFDQYVNEVLVEDTIDRYAMNFTLTGEFVIMNIDADDSDLYDEDVPSADEIFRREKTEDGGALLRIHELWGGYMTRAVVVKQGDSVAEVTNCFSGNVTESDFVAYYN